MNELLLRRRVASKILPYDAEVEYIKTDGNGAYIDTLIEGTSNTGYDISMTMDELPYAAGNTVGFIFGARVGNKNKSTALYIYNTGGTGNYERGFGWRYGNKEVYRGFNPLWGDYSISNLTSKRVLVVNGNNITCDSATFSSGYNIYIFGVNNAGSFMANVEQVRVLKYHYFKIYNGNTLVRDYIPVRKGTTGYMYDKVSKQLFGNAGTGSFVLGPDK